MESQYGLITSPRFTPHPVLHFGQFGHMLQLHLLGGELYSKIVKVGNAASTKSRTSLMNN